MAPNVPDSRRCYAYLMAALAALLCTLTLSRNAGATYPERISRLPATYNYVYAPTLATKLAKADNGQIVVPIPAAFGKFPFYGELYATLTITTNGYILLGDRSAEAVDTLPKRFGEQPTVPARMIAPWWQDWTLARGGAVYYGLAEGAFIVEWWDVSQVWDGSGATYSFELKLFPDGRFEFHYLKAVDPIGASPVTGGRGGAVGYHEAFDTAGENIFFGSAALFNRQVVERQWPGEAVIWARALDTLGRPRGDVLFDVTAKCPVYSELGFEYRFDANGASTGPLGWQPNTLCRSLSPPYFTRSQTEPLKDLSVLPKTRQSSLDPYDVALYSMRPVVERGTHSFVSAVVAPAPTTKVTLEREYPQVTTGASESCWSDDNCRSGGPERGVSVPFKRKSTKFGQGRCDKLFAAVGICKWPSRLDWYYRLDGGPINERVLLIVPGIDATNIDGTAKYYAAQNGIFGPDEPRTLDDLRKAGFDVAIGDWGDGDRPLSQLADEVATWIDQAYLRTYSSVRAALGGSAYRQILVAGVSLGGVVVRDALTKPGRTTGSKVQAWFSIDSPQLGANLGRADVGLQTLLACHAKDATPPKEAEYWQIFSRAAGDMKFENVENPDDCSCDDTWPHKSRCTASTTRHDAYYRELNSRPWATPRGYGVSFGDGVNLVPLRTAADVNADKDLFEWAYPWPASNAGWQLGYLDALSGSTYISRSDVDTSDILSLKFQPSFIPVHSALATTATTIGSCVPGPGMWCGYTSIARSRWYDFATNQANWPHCRVSKYLARKIENWMRLETGLPARTESGFGPETSLVVPPTPSCTGP